jgi:uncharacterized NAD(P)/FAD-binding protein YdhS
MKWQDIHKQYPNQFVLLGDIVEEKVSDFKSKIIEGTVIEVFDNGSDIRKAYRERKKRGEKVLYSLPTTSDEFIVENIPFKGFLK